MRPLPFVWPYALIFWGIHIWAFAPEWRIIRAGSINAKRAGSSDRGSIAVIMGVTWIALMVAYPLAFTTKGAVSPRLRLPVFIAGLALMILGGLLRRACIRTLGTYFTGDVQARSDQTVVASGPYRLVRHPSYSAGIMMFAGIGLALTNWLSVALLTIATIAAYSYRVSVEERLLAETIGEPYVNYMKERKRFIPHIV